MAFAFGRVAVRDPVVGELTLEGDGFATGADPIRLAADATVQTSLGLSSEEAERASGVWRDYRAALAEAASGDTSPGSGAAPRAEAAAHAVRALAELLGRERQEKLRRLAWRLQGGFALADPAVAEALGLRREQDEQVERLVRRRAAALDDLKAELRHVRMDAHALELRLAKLHEEGSAKLLEVLTAEQRERLAELVEATEADSG